MASNVSFLQMDLTHIALYMFGLILLDFIVRLFRELITLVAIETEITMRSPELGPHWDLMVLTDDDETPIQRLRSAKHFDFGKLHRAKVLAGVRKRLDEQF